NGPLTRPAAMASTKTMKSGAILCSAAHLRHNYAIFLVTSGKVLVYCTSITKGRSNNSLSYAVKVLGGCDLGAVTRSRRISESRSDAFKLQGFGLAFFLGSSQRPQLPFPIEGSQDLYRIRIDCAVDCDGTEFRSTCQWTETWQVVERESVVDHSHIESSEDHSGDQRGQNDSTQHMRAPRRARHCAKGDI